MTTTPDFRALCAEIVETWDATADFNFNDFGHAAADIVDRARAALTTPPPEPPTNEEILDLMPEEMRAEFSNTSKLYSTAMHGQVKPGIFRVVLNTMALEYVRAALDRWGK